VRLLNCYSRLHSFFLSYRYSLLQSRNKISK